MDWTRVDVALAGARARRPRPRDARATRAASRVGRWPSTRTTRTTRATTDGSIARADDETRRRTRDDDDATTRAAGSARARDAWREYEKIARAYAEAHEDFGTSARGAPLDAEALRRERDKTRNLIAKVRETPVGANRTLIRRKEYLDRMIENAEAREALMEDGRLDERGGGASTRRDARRVDEVDDDGADGGAKVAGEVAQGARWEKI